MADIRNNQRGATLVEGAVVLPILIFTIVSILELGVAFKDFLTTDFATKEGARVGALVGNDIDADCLIVQSIVAGYTASDFDDLDSITIFKVKEDGTQDGGLANEWEFPNAPSDDPANCDDWNKTTMWPSVDRDVSVGGGSDLDIIGVTIDTTHDWITGVPPWSGQMNIVRTAIQRLEPEAFE